MVRLSAGGKRGIDPIDPSRNIFSSKSKGKVESN